MKTGEKAAIGIVLALVLGMIALGISYEPGMKNQTNSPAQEKQAESESLMQDALLIPPGMTADALPDPESEGARALALYCTQCHDLPIPAMHSVNEWPMVLGRMRAHMSKRRGGMLVRIIEPPEKAWTSLTDYLGTHALRPLTSPGPAAETPAFQTFQRFCGQCHEVPEPSQHTAKEWERTLLRMKTHMQRARKEVPNDSDSRMILDFLSGSPGNDPGINK